MTATIPRRYTVTDSLNALPAPIAAYATFAEALAARDRLETERGGGDGCRWGFRYLVGLSEQ